MLSNLLYQLGPECFPSSIKTPEASNVLIPSYIEVTNKDTTIVNQGPVSDMELLSLQVN